MQLKTISFEDGYTQPSNDIKRIIDSAEISFGGTDAKNRTNFMTISLLIQSVEDYTVLMEIYSDEPTVKQRCKDIILNKIRENDELIGFSDVDYDEIYVFILHGIDYATCAHTTHKENLYKIMPPNKDQAIILKNKDYYGDYGDGVYFFLKDSDKAVNNIKKFISEAGNSFKEQVVLYFDYSYLKYPNIRMYIHNEMGYIFCKSDVIIPQKDIQIEWIVE